MPVICTYAYAIVKRRENMEEAGEKSRIEAALDAAESKME